MIKQHCTFVEKSSAPPKDVWSPRDVQLGCMNLPSVLMMSGSGMSVAGRLHRSEVPVLVVHPGVVAPRRVQGPEADGAFGHRSAAVAAGTVDRCCRASVSVEAVFTGHLQARSFGLAANHQRSLS